MNDEELASAIENMALLALTYEEWTNAMKMTDVVLSIYPESEWNLIIRSLAARQLKQPKLAKESWDKWLASGGGPESSVGNYMREDLWEGVEQRLAEKPQPRQKNK